MRRALLALLFVASPLVAQTPINPGRGALSRGLADSLYCALSGCTPTGAFNVKDTLFTVQDDGDATKQGRFQLSGVTAGQTRVLTWPDFDGTLATLAGGAFTGASSFAADLTLGATSKLGWGSSGVGTPDTFLVRDGAANVLALKNGATGQTLRIYNTDDGAGNFERGVLAWSSNTFLIQTAIGGTGTARNLRLNAATGAEVDLQVAGATVVQTVAAGIAVTGALSATGNVTHSSKTILDGTAQSLAAYTTAGADLSILARSITDTSSSGTVAVNAVNSVGIFTLLASSATTYTDSAAWYFAGPPVASTNITQTRVHSVLIADPTTASSSITGGFVVATTPGTAATSVSIGGGNINAGGTVTAGTPIAATSGGTGQSSFTQGDLLYASSTSALSKLADVAAGSYLRSGGAGANPVYSTVTLPNTASTGNVLIATGTNSVVAVTPALNHASPANQTGNATSTLKMNGLGAAGAPCTVTPVATGRVIFTITGQLAQTTTADGVTTKLAFGTGAAPANAAAATGTVISATITHTALTGALEVPFAITTSTTGLTLSTAVWFDLQVANVTGGTASITNVDCTAWEM